MQVTERYGNQRSAIDSVRVVEPAETPRSTVIFVHGSMDRQTVFSPVIDRLPDIRCVAYDRRGYGSSIGVPGPYSVAVNVDDLESVIASLGTTSEPSIPPVVLVGHSFGGVITLALAARRPELVRAVAVYESPMSWEPWWSSSSGGAVAARTRHDPERAAEEFLVRFIGRRRWDSLSETTKTRRRAEGVALTEELSDLRRGAAYRFDDIRCPIVSSVGSLAAPHIRRGAEMLAKATTGPELVVLDGARHGAPHERPDDFVSLVVRRCLDLVS